MAVFLSRRCPHWLFGFLSSQVGKAYWAACPGRRRVVFENLLPVVNGDRLAARIATRELFQQFALKLADLWRYEGGLSIVNLVRDFTGWQAYERVREQKRGVLIVTLHLGNWEFGAPLLTQRGVQLKVITGPEPDPRLTALRQVARQRWGIETIALGENPFSAIQVVNLLQAGHTVALLMDRPHPATAVPVTLFGRPFQASVAAAELARASGCAVLPVCLPRTSRGYLAQILPEVAYDRRAIGNREGRIEFTQRILSAFEPSLRFYVTQWYHFVPIWPELAGAAQGFPAAAGADSLAGRPR